LTTTNLTTATSTEVIVLVTCVAAIILTIFVYVNSRRRCISRRRRRRCRRCRRRRGAVAKARELDPQRNPTEEENSDDEEDYFDVTCNTCSGTYKSASGTTTDCIECRPRISSFGLSELTQLAHKGQQTRRASMACSNIPMYQPNAGAQFMQTPLPTVNLSTRGTRSKLASKMGTLVSGERPARRDSNGFLSVDCETCGVTYKSASGNTTQCTECRPPNSVQTPAPGEHDVSRKRVSPRLSIPTHLKVQTLNV
jgi:hypothetical protein